MNPELLSQQIGRVLVTIMMGVIALLFLGIIGFMAFLWWKWRNREKDSLKKVTLLVAVPQDNEVKIDACEQIIASFSSIYKSAKIKLFQKFIAQPSISLEIIGTHDDIKFYVSVPEKFKDMVEKQIYGVYTGCHIEEVEEANVYTSDGKIETLWMTIKKGTYLPLKTYKEIATDPLAAISSTMSKLDEKESLVIQMTMSPSDGKWAKMGRSFISSTKKSESNPEKAAYKVEGKQLEAIEQKTSQPGFETAIRIVAVAPTKEIAKTNISNIKSCFRQFESPWNKFTSKKIRIKSMFMMDFIYKYPPIMWLKNKCILSSDEVAGIFHFPNKSIETPNIYWLKAKKAPAPVNSPQDGLYIGDNSYRGVEKKFCMGKEDRQRHFYIVGQTGVGKSWLLADIKDIKVNDLRNTFIVFQLKSGVPIDVVSQIVGHKRISTTEKYLELIDSKEEAKGIKLKEL